MVWGRTKTDLFIPQNSPFDSTNFEYWAIHSVFSDATSSILNWPYIARTTLIALFCKLTFGPSIKKFIIWDNSPFLQNFISCNLNFLGWLFSKGKSRRVAEYSNIPNSRSKFVPVQFGRRKGHGMMSKFYNFHVNLYLGRRGGTKEAVNGAQ